MDFYMEDAVRIRQQAEDLAGARERYPYATDEEWETAMRVLAEGIQRKRQGEAALNLRLDRSLPADAPYARGAADGAPWLATTPGAYRVVLDVCQQLEMYRGWK